MLRLTARYADAWNAEWKSVAQVAELREAVDAVCAAEGREPATLERTAAVRVAVPGLARRSPIVLSNEITGTVEELAAQLHAYADAGITHIQAMLFPNTRAAIERFAAVLPLLH
jgi:alkanesulfonate monooxygenase SsuD/methylene tetrahydromethanopterin reductase-like flavin-dependent oxidoreductase (luciferase family)